MKHKPRSPYGDAIDYGAKFTSNNEPHGMDPPPALNRMHCRTCGEVVVGLKCPNPKCEANAK